jgi:hypothetical protein
LIKAASLDPSTESGLDTWFEARGIHRANIRLQISPYAKLDWLTRFPRYAATLKDDLSAYDNVLRDAVARRERMRVDLDPDPAVRMLAHNRVERVLALAEAREVFLAQHDLGILDDIQLLRNLTRLSMEHAEAYDPPAEAYQLPPFDAEAYTAHALLPVGQTSQTRLGAEANAEAFHNLNPTAHRAPDIQAQRSTHIGGHGRPRGHLRSRTAPLVISPGDSKAPRVTRSHRRKRPGQT